ncbi:MAG: hypothetical protein IKM39_00540 [Clostridia bacterium]|nr:hypothetical protein [Clostridia bacterium]
MKKAMSYILVFTLLLWVLTLGIPTAGAHSPVDVAVGQTGPLASGDVNNDRVINAKDALLVLQIEVDKYPATPEERIAANVMIDGGINAKDALEILKYAVGKPSYLTQEGITVATIWYDTYAAADATGKAWQTTLSALYANQGIATHLQQLDAEKATDTIVRNVMPGRVGSDIYEVTLSMCRDIARQKAAANIFQSKTLDKSLYGSGATQSATFSGKVYGVALPGQNTNVAGILYNKELIRKYAPDTDIQTLFNQKEWTFEAFQTLAKKCTVDSNSDGKTDIYGFTSNTNIIGMAITANTGGMAIMKDDRVEATMCNHAGVAALEWCKEMFIGDKSWKYFGDIYDSVDAFANGKAAMFVSYLSLSPAIADKANFPMGFVMMPMGFDQTQYINGVYDASMYMVPKTNVKRLDDIGYWLNGIAGVSEDLFAEKRQELVTCGIDQAGCDMYQTLVLSMTPEFSTGALSASTADMINSLVTATSAPNKKLEAIRLAAQRELDEYYAPFYE